MSLACTTAYRRTAMARLLVVVAAVFATLYSVDAASVVSIDDHLPHHNVRHAPVYEEIQGALSAENVSWWQWVKRVFHLGHTSDEDDLDESQATYMADTQPTLAYNQTTAVYLAYVTSVAYCQAHHIRDWSCSPCALVQPLEEITVVQDKKNSFQGLVGYNRERDTVLVAFRGSMDIPNWIDNLTFIKRKAYAQYPEVKVHQGFYWVYDSVAPQVVAAVQALMATHPTAKIVVTGHSLGGAVAALSTFDLAVLHRIPVHSVYTFGEPRVGNSNFSMLLNQAVPEVYRVTHYRDAVPHLPPTWIGFRHTAQEIFYDEYASMYTVCDPEDGEDPACSDACAPFGCTSIVDHLNYLNVTMSHLIC